ncbi:MULTISPECIES: DeoR/GlpR family DNA-binding transcription regulator [Ruegeria]|uniref:DeoR/GlpR family DNA-binding transcription regulator n=1 Tax=Ruegeria TaxID=97050 RepID=UPI001480017A|nr:MULTISPECIES: DeoR/GlpR family DNA-binding transcription regulator [Ruegeria]
MASKKIRRRDLIQQVVQERGGVSVGALAEMLGVSTQTIRRDLDILCDGENLRRAHGRIELAESRLNTPFDQRAGTNLRGKRSVSELVASMIPNGANVFLSIGSTPLEVAKALSGHQELTVITNNLSAAMALSNEISNRILLPGGELRLPDRDFIGEEATDFFDRFRAEFAIFGVAGVAHDGGLLEFHPAEVRVRMKMQQHAAKSILVIDSSKFGRIAPALGGNISDVDVVVCDRPPGPEFSDLADSLGEAITYSQGER